MRVWDETQQVRKSTRNLKRDRVFEYICRYAQEHNGVTPGFLTIGRAFNLCYSTVRGHVAELAMEGKLRLEDRQIIVEDSEWIPPPYYEK